MRKLDGLGFDSLQFHDTITSPHGGMVDTKHSKCFDLKSSRFESGWGYGSCSLTDLIWFTFCGMLGSSQQLKSEGR